MDIHAGLPCDIALEKISSLHFFMCSFIIVSARKGSLEVKKHLSAQCCFWLMMTKT